MTGADALGRQRRARWATIVLVGVVTMWTAPAITQQGKLSDADLKALTMSAKTAQDHAKLAAHYRAHAAEHVAEAKLHEQLANQYDKTSPQLAGEARHYAAHSAEAAEALANLAKIHDTMGKTAK